MLLQILDALVTPPSYARSNRGIIRIVLLGLILVGTVVPAATGQSIRFTTHPNPVGLTHSPTPINEEYVYDADARASNGAALRYRLIRAPKGMKVNPLTGVVTWRPEANGAHVVELRAELAGNSGRGTSQEWIVAVPGRPIYSDYQRVSSSVYHDDNGNCTHEPEETTLTREIVEILPGPIYRTTGDIGDLSIVLAPGTYTFNHHPKRNRARTCPDQETTITLPDTSARSIMIGVGLIPGIYDVRASLAAGPARPGFDVTYTLVYENVGTERASGRVIFEPDSRLIYKTATTEPDRQIANRLEWDFANLPVGRSVAISIVLSVPRSIERNTELCAFADVRLERKDDREFLGDNRDSVCVTVTGAHDPNDILVAPIRFDEEYDNAPLFPGDTVLSYLVRFQNTGNDTAFTVIVVDTLDASLLDINSIQLGAASHDFDFDISGAGILTWTFNNILLPDSGVNELASHGYFKYTITLRKGLAPMTEIPNRAAIYFDYNDPVITNTVVSITSGTLGVEEETTAASSLQIYPNPVQETSSIRLNLTEREHVKLRLIDGSGDVIAILTDKEMSAGEHTLSLDARELSSGAYYLVLDRGGMEEIYPVVVNR